MEGDPSPSPAPTGAVRSGRLAQVRSAIVTGSSSGIGRGIALAFAAMGVGLVICADLLPTVPKAKTVDGTAAGEAGAAGAIASKTNESSDTILATHELINNRHGQGRAVFVCCDVSIEHTKHNASKEQQEAPSPAMALESSNPVGIADLVAIAVKMAGRLDVMVNNAGIPILDISLHKMGLKEWNRSLSVNATGPFLGSKHAVAQFLAQAPDAHGFRGTVINVSSIGGLVGLMRCSAYCAAKASIIGLTRAAAIEYGDMGIRCNVLCPGYIATPFLMPYVDASPEFADYLHRLIPAGRLGQPADVAGAAVWLANGQESGYVNGIALSVDGGFTAR